MSTGRADPGRQGGASVDADVREVLAGRTRVAYVRENNIYVEQLETAKINQLTHDGTDPPRTRRGGVIINGTSDWVYEEELNVRDGFRWSPDGAPHRLLAVRHDRRRDLFPD